MENLVDLHSHILPGLDDGPNNLAETLEILEELEKLGFGHVFATPHHRLYSWEGIEPETVVNGVLEVTHAARQRDISIKILPGMEFDLDDTLPERAASPPGDAGHLLVDMGFLGVPFGLSELIGRMTDTGITILLAHPERNEDLCRQRNELSGLIASGVRFLGNIGSFSGMYGRKVKRNARSLLEDGYYWAVASDMHSSDQSKWIRDGIKELRSLAGDSVARELTQARPMQLVEAMEREP